MAELYIMVSEMSIVGPPPSYLGGVFFCKKTALGSTLKSGTEGYMTHYAYSLISGAASLQTIECRS